MRDVLDDLEIVLAGGSLPPEPSTSSPRPAPPIRPDARGATPAVRWGGAPRVEVDRPDWPENWETRRDPADWIACRRMWAEALRQQIRDVALAHLAAFDEFGGAIPPKRRAVEQAWIGGRDFNLVCDLAGLDGEALAWRLRPLLSTRDGAERLHAALASYKPAAA